jgi:hypothetical protein
MPEPWQPILDIADKLQPEARRLFLKAFNDVRASINIEQLAEAIRVGDFSRTMRLLNLDPAAGSFQEVRNLFAKAFQQAGVAATQSPPGGFLLRFDMRNPFIPRIIDQHIGMMIVEIDANTRGAVQAIIQTAFREGGHPYQTAKLIQDVVGLHSRWANAVQKYRGQLIADGKTPWRVEDLTARYANRLRKKRAISIARTETITAANMGQLESWRQSVEAGNLPVDVKKKWLVTPDDRLCKRCAPMRLHEPVGLGEMFTSNKVGFPPGPLEDAPLMMVLQPTLHPQCRCTMALSVD